MQSRTYIKLVQIARLRCMGWKDDVICNHLGLSRSGLSQITSRPEYKDVENSVLEGKVSKMDELLAGQVEEQKRVMEVAVPMALRALVDNVAQRKDLRACMKAAEEILDRDPKRTFAKQSRTVSDSQLPSIGDADLSKLILDADNVVSQVKNKPAN